VATGGDRRSKGMAARSAALRQSLSTARSFGRGSCRPRRVAFALADQRDDFERVTARDFHFE
jgi:hypothetical protein